MQNFTVYKHTSPSGKVYIGITCRTLKQRSLWGYGYKRNPYFWNAIQKYGWDNFKHEVICPYLTKPEACELERELIAYFDSTNPKKGYNHSGGGGGAFGIQISKETRHKMSIAHKGKKMSDEHKRHSSEAKTGEKNPMYGVKGSLNSKSKIILMYDSSNNLLGEFECLREAMEKLNLPDGAFKNISACALGKRKSAYGYIWRYKE